VPIKKKLLLGDRILDDNATAKLLLFEDSGNDLTPTDSGFAKMQCSPPSRDV
jgi:hypothetical protein